MPLSFASENFGMIAFGFFNIESDMLLLENYFFFADEFCNGLLAVASNREKGPVQFEIPAYLIENRENIGDLAGAIHGISFSGFIGDIYKVFPFPETPEGFKQNPLGYQTQKTVAPLIKERAKTTLLRMRLQEDGRACIGPYHFSKENFFGLIRYVWMGGYPRWKDNIRPGYVINMRQGLEDSCHPCFEGVFSSMQN